MISFKTLSPDGTLDGSIIIACPKLPKDTDVRISVRKRGYDHHGISFHDNSKS